MMSKRDVYDTDKIYEVTSEQAQGVLNAFLDMGREVFSDLKIGTVSLDYSQQSVVEALQFIAGRIEAGNLNEAEQNVWFGRLGYYLGESLRKKNPALVWGLGDPEYAFANHPVIMGFHGDEEAPVITVCKNLISAVVERISPASRIENGVRNWFEKR